MNTTDVNLIRKIAWSFNRMTGMDYEELFSEACLGYAEAVNLYNKNNGAKFSSFAWSVIRNKLRLFVRNEKKHFHTTPVSMFATSNETSTDDVLDELATHAEQCRTFEELIHGWSADLRRIAEITVSVGSEECDNVQPDYWLRAAVRERLREEGWSWPRIWSGIRNLKDALNHS